MPILDSDIEACVFVDAGQGRYRYGCAVLRWPSGGWTAYIGHLDPHDQRTEQEQARWIARSGAPLAEAIARLIFPQVEGGYELDYHPPARFLKGEQG